MEQDRFLHAATEGLHAAHGISSREKPTPRPERFAGILILLNAGGHVIFIAHGENIHGLLKTHAPKAYTHYHCLYFDDCFPEIAAALVGLYQPPLQPAIGPNNLYISKHHAKTMRAVTDKRQFAQMMGQYLPAFTFKGVPYYYRSDFNEALEAWKSR